MQNVKAHLIMLIARIIGVRIDIDQSANSRPL